MGDITRLLVRWAHGDGEAFEALVPIVYEELRNLADRAGAATRVELRYFGGLSVEETAAYLGVAPVTVKRHWAVARAWLFNRLSDAAAGPGKLRNWRAASAALRSAQAVGPAITPPRGRASPPGDTRSGSLRPSARR